MNNLLAPTKSESESPSANKTLIAGLPAEKVASRLDALLFVLKSCWGVACREPWQQLHPADDNVRSLADALHPRFDEIYSAKQTRVRYEFCANGYLVDAEGPMWGEDADEDEDEDEDEEVSVHLLMRDGVRWEEWI